MQQGFLKKIFIIASLLNVFIVTDTSNSATGGTTAIIAGNAGMGGGGIGGTTCSLMASQPTCVLKNHLCGGDCEHTCTKHLTVTCGGWSTIIDEVYEDHIYVTPTCVTTTISDTCRAINGHCYGNVTVACIKISNVSCNDGTNNNITENYTKISNVPIDSYVCSELQRLTGIDTTCRIVELTNPKARIVTTKDCEFSSSGMLHWCNPKADGFEFQISDNFIASHLYVLCRNTELTMGPFDGKCGMKHRKNFVIVLENECSTL